MKKILITVFLFSISFLLAGQHAGIPAFINSESKAWADSVFHTMNEPEKIGQLFMVAAFSNRDTLHVNEISSLIRDYHIGGLIFFQGGPVRQARLTNYYQGLSKVPLLISIDGEWGLSMRLDSTMRFPRQMTLAAMPSDSLIYPMGAEIGRQCKRLGIHVNFAPDIDINNNPLNPIINSRSFGEDKNSVATKGLLYMKGMQDQHVLACGKHFPGHGNADSDSHFTLPLIQQSRSTLDSVELYPFKMLIKDGLGSIMVAHLFVPALDSTPGRASTLSENIVTNLLKKDLEFKGLVITDALNMKGVSAYNGPGFIEIKALEAGNDILLNTENVPLAAEMIHLALQNCELDSGVFNSQVKKILQAKHWVGLNNPKLIDIQGLDADLQNEQANWLNYRLYENSQTLLINKNKILPFRNLEESKLASLVINDSLNNKFQQTLNEYAPVKTFQISKDADDKTIKSMVNDLSAFSPVVISIHNTSTNAGRNFNITPQVSKLVKLIQSKTKVILVVFGNAYVLSKVEDVKNCEALLLAYEDTYLPHLMAAQVLFGASIPKGHLPVTPSADFNVKDGLKPERDPSRLKLTMPEEVGLTSLDLAGVDSLALKGIRAGAYPGCQVLIALKNKIIYNKSFGYQTYDSSKAVTNSNLYDIASITKIASTALATMYLVEKGEIDLNKKISKYLPELKKTNKKDITLREMLTHQAGLQAWIPFFEATLKSGKTIYEIYHHEPDLNYSIRVADSLYLKNDYPEKIWKTIIDSEVKDHGTYVYSDLDLIIMQKIIERVSGTTLDEFVTNHFYTPLGITRLTYRPLTHIEPNELVPTELDTVFRKQLIHGDVHDPAAAMMGGVAGHAGIFSNAASLSVIMQMLLNGGTYGDHQFLKKETIAMFTSRQYPDKNNRRGLIFDKPEVDPKKNGPTCKTASKDTFGHTGFTGTCAWADPENQFIFIFLSNRVNPTSLNNKLATLNIRTDMQQVVYDALIKK